MRKRKYGEDLVKVELEITFNRRKKPILCGKKGGKMIFHYSEGVYMATLVISSCGMYRMEKVWRKSELVYILGKHAIDPINPEIIDEYLRASDEFLEKLKYGELL